jgi:hypothetical protein
MGHARSCATARLLRRIYISVRNSGVVLITNYADYPCRKTRVHDDAFLEDPDDYLSEYSDDDSA